MKRRDFLRGVASAALVPSVPLEPIPMAGAGARMTLDRVSRSMIKANAATSELRGATEFLSLILDDVSVGLGVPPELLEKSANKGGAK